MEFSNYLPDELLLEILKYIERWDTNDKQDALAQFSAVCRQWHNVAIPILYESPYLAGHAYELFVRTICPSVIARIKPSALSGLVRVLDLSHIVHNSNKATTARLLGRTKSSLRIFIAPQASFAINCWASLSKCSHLQVLDLSLVSEAISFQSLNQTMRQLGDLRELYLPRCSTSYEVQSLSMNIRWPPRLEHLSLSGSVYGQFLYDMLRKPENFPPTLYSFSILHCPNLDHRGIRPLLSNISHSLTVVELRDLPTMRHGKLNSVLDWLPKLHTLTIALDYIDEAFGCMPTTFSPAHWAKAKPLHTLTIVACGQMGIEPARSFSAVDLYALIDERFLGRLRFLNIAKSTEWMNVSENAELGALEMLLTDELDKENWVGRRWHYADLPPMGDLTYEQWVKTEKGQKMRAKLRILKNR